MHRYSYADFHRRVHALAHALAALGVKPGDRVGTLCWNSFRHLELYFAIPCYGAVMHTLNLRLASDQLAYIINHAEDQVIFVDASLVPLLDPIRDQIPCVKRIVILPDARLPARRLRAVARIRARRSRTRGRSSTKTPPPPLATHPEPPAIPKAFSTRIAPCSCTASRSRWPTPSQSPSATPSCKSCPCFTPTAGAFRSPL